MEDLQVHHHITKLSTEWNEEQEELAGHKAYELHIGFHKIEGHNEDVHKTNFLRSYVPTKGKNTANGLTIHTKERMTGASLHMMGLLLLSNKEKKTTRP